MRMKGEDFVLGIKLTVFECRTVISILLYVIEAPLCHDTLQHVKYKNGALIYPKTCETYLSLYET